MTSAFVRVSGPPNSNFLVGYPGISATSPRIEGKVEVRPLLGVSAPVHVSLVTVCLQRRESIHPSADTIKGHLVTSNRREITDIVGKEMLLYRAPLGRESEAVLSMDLPFVIFIPYGRGGEEMARRVPPASLQLDRRAAETYYEIGQIQTKSLSSFQIQYSMFLRRSFLFSLSRLSYKNTAIVYHQRLNILPYLSSKNIITTTTSTPQATTNTTMPAAQSTFKGLPVIPPNDPSLTATTTTPRAIRKVFEAIDQAEGAGARVRRSVGTRELKNFTPFLMLDHFTIAPGAGFPDHPHRGQETITYLLSGAVDHEDFAGNAGTIYAGDLQFMTAGRGIVHAEMPAQNPDGSANIGMQLWVDLPAHLKDCEPRYRDLRGSEIPVANSPDKKVNVKVISGRAYGVDSLQELAYTPVWLLDVTVQPGGTFDAPLPHKWNAFIYTLSGSIVLAGPQSSKTIPQYHNAVLEQSGDSIVASVPASAEKESRFILVAGMPLDQPIVQYGPFVQTSTEGIYKAMADYQGYANGFERAENWESEIGKTMVH